MYAVVTIDVQINDLQDCYDYNIPNEFVDYIGIGSRVMVEFGFRKVLGYVVEIKNQTDYKGTIRDIVEILDYNQELSVECVEIGKKISNDIKCPLSKCLEGMIPSYLKSKFRKFISIVDENRLDPNILLLFKGKNKIALTKEIIKNYPKIKREIEKNNIKLEYDLYEYGKTKKIKYYSLNDSCENIYESFVGTKQILIKYLSKKKEATLDEIKEFVGCSRYLVNDLLSKEILKLEERDLPSANEKNKALLNRRYFDFDGKELVNKYSSNSDKPFLLSCGDSKFINEFYLDICIDNIINNKKTIILCPTIISLYNIYYYIRRNLKGFEVLHLSGDISQKDHYINYTKLRNNEADVLICTKVGLYVTMNDLGTIVVHDENNFNYINEYTPKCNAVEVMKYRAKFNKAKLVLQSSPLTIDNYYSYYNADYSLLKMNESNNSNVELVDMNESLLENRNVISKTLERKIANALDKHKQVFLILNSRGYSTTLKCKACGKVAKCPTCHIALTYYKDKNEFKCKYCGKNVVDLKCSCGRDNYSIFGIGIDQVEEVVKRYFPLASVMKLDSEMLSNFKDYENAVVRIESNDVDIVVGTSNVLGFSSYANLDLIGLISADTLLNSSDYRASYSTFELIYKSIKATNVVIQGYDLSHYSIRYGINKDFISFYNEEIKERKLYNYPPFTEMNKIIITGEYKDIYYCANYFRKIYSIVTKKQNMVLGPIYIKMKKGVQLLVKCDDFEMLSKLLDDVEKKFNQSNIMISFERYPRTF